MKIRQKKLYQIQNYIFFDLSIWLNEMDDTESELKWNGMGSTENMNERMNEFHCE